MISAHKTIQQVLFETPMVRPDAHPNEPRMRAIGKTDRGRYVFLVFMLRNVAGKTKLRPISARYIHQKEVNHYENQI